MENVHVHVSKTKESLFVDDLFRLGELGAELDFDFLELELSCFIIKLAVKGK